MSGSTYIGPGAAVGSEYGDLVAVAAKALTKPKNFAYWGDLDPAHGWGWTGLSSCKNEDDPINRSNMRVIFSDLHSRWPSHVVIENSAHWAVGSMDELRVKVLRRPSRPITPSNITPAFRAMVAWADKLDSYPIADESDYGELEQQEAEAAGWIYCEDRGEYRDPSDCKADGHKHEES